MSVVLVGRASLPHLVMYVQSLAFRVRQLRPCALTNLTYDIDLPEDNELQVNARWCVCVCVLTHLCLCV